MNTPLEVRSVIGRLRDHAWKVRDVWPHTSKLLDEAADMLERSEGAPGEAIGMTLAPQVSASKTLDRPGGHSLLPRLS
jgi:hypothetical protein